ncbi:MAG: glycosyltransferase family 2 protein, partial [Leptolyngbyaceae cyanobacterium SL_1_1]|nr:glycosyltransferase family 2 protein [Leptolyngbyaceae cyanobacterium SL_1_1]
MTQTSQALPQVSVIIPVFNDMERLQHCLVALEQQTYPQSHYEVVVIDNGSDNQNEVLALVEQFSQAIAACETVPGSYAARNKGIKVAKGEVIAFTDADCIPAADWIEQGVYWLNQHPGCGLVAGQIELFFKNPERLTPV